MSQAKIIRPGILPKLCVSLGNIAHQDCLNIIDRYDFVELRTDLLKYSLQDIQSLVRRPGYSIVTIKGDSIKEKDAFIAECISAGADLIDLQFGDTLLDNTDFIRKYRQNLIISHHASGTTSLEEAYAVVDSLINLNVRYIKFIFDGINHSQAIKSCYLISRYKAKYFDSPTGLISFATGEKGRFTRLNSVINCDFTYCKPDELEAIAEGQIDFSVLRNYYDPKERKLQKYVVSGNPIAHSLSPAIFNSLFQKYSVNAHYSRIAASSAASSIVAAKLIGLSAMNLTAPFKQNIAELTGEKASEAGLNTLIFENDAAHGENTDITGFKSLLEIHCPNMKSALVLGSGASAASAIIALKECRFEKIYILARNAEKRQRLIYKYGCGDISQYEGMQIDALISTIPADADFSFLHECKCSFRIVIDAIYTKSNLAQYAKQVDTKYLDGRELLKKQAEPLAAKISGFKSLKIDDTPILRKVSNISFVGRPDVGKSCHGKIASEKLGMKFLDLDEEIEARAGASISEIFRLQGEKHFRNLENNLLAEMLTARNTIISTGGGAVESAYNRKLLRQMSYVIWILDDKHGDKDNNDTSRPLNMLYTLPERDIIYQQRDDYYFECSDIIILASELDKNKVRDFYEEIYKQIQT